MAENKHHGVGVIITNEERDLFYLERKNGTYPHPEYRLCLSFFGGGIENGETPLRALERELMEELGEGLGKAIAREAKELNRFEVPTGDSSYDFTLCEVVLPTRRLRELDGYKAKEGTGVIISKENGVDSRFIWNLETVFLSYINQ